MAKTVRLIGAESEQLGVLSIREAMDHARDAGLDLVEIAPNGEPPVCRIMDYSKYAFEQKKKKQAQKKKQSKTQLKEIKLRPVTDIGDYNVKLTKIRRFLEQGHKVKVTVHFRGREIMYHEKGLEIMQRVQNDLEEQAMIEHMPKQEGRQISMIVSAKKAA